MGELCSGGAVADPFSRPGRCGHSLSGNLGRSGAVRPDHRLRCRNSKVGRLQAATPCLEMSAGLVQ